MNDDKKKGPAHTRWAHFRFGVIGPLLVNPPRRGKLKVRLRQLSERSYVHPTSGEPVQFGLATVERWYYEARAAADPVAALRRKVREDLGRTRTLPPAQQDALREQWMGHSDWTWRLHFDNLVALTETDPGLGTAPSYATVRRYMKGCGMRPLPRQEDLTDGEAFALRRRDEREVRSYEMEHVNALWHADFHVGSLKVLVGGEWLKPLCLCVIDDRSRLVCHAQWYLVENAENANHGLMQALLKRGLPRALMTDNGCGFICGEMQEGLRRLSVTSELTLSHSPYQNGKQESFWSTLEGRLIAMVHQLKGLTLQVLNEMTQAWVEHEYQVHRHSETNQTPLQRYLDGPDTGRPPRGFEELRAAFRRRSKRRQRQGDGTISLEAVRFEIPVQYRHLSDVCVAYATWDMQFVHLWDERNDLCLSRIHPLDRARNSDGRRRGVPVDVRGPKPATTTDRSTPPLLKKLLDKQSQSGLPAAFLTQDNKKDKP